MVVRGTVLALVLLSSSALVACGEAAPPPGPVVLPGAGTATGSTPVADGTWDEPCDSDSDCSMGGYACHNGICEPRSASSGNGAKGGNDADGQWQPGTGGSGGAGGTGGSSARCTSDYDCDLSDYCDSLSGSCVPYDSGGGSGGFCFDDIDCSAGEICDPFYGICTPDPSGGPGGGPGSLCIDDTDCDINDYCDDGTCTLY